MHDRESRYIFLGTLTAALLGCAVFLGLRPTAVAKSPAESLRWWKGNLHTHTLWSDGDDFPDMITDWYKTHGYNFLALSDHNTFQTGQRWVTILPRTNPVAAEWELNHTHASDLALEKYLARFGSNWVEQRTKDGKAQTRLKTLVEFRTKFEEPDKFLMIQSEELTDAFNKIPIHINATNPRKVIKPQHGTSMLDVMQNNINAINAQRQETGQTMIPHLNHPNFGWAVTAEDLMQLKGDHFFEVYNGHPATYTLGDKTHASTDRLWDIILTWRISKLGLEPMYALANDDSHYYHEFSSKESNPGRGWIMIHSPQLNAESLINAMETGDFYASSGVKLSLVERSPKAINVEIAAEPGVTYKTQFIGTRQGYDDKHSPITDDKGGKLRVTEQYSKDIGAVLAEVEGTSAAYNLKGDEIYVRAKIISSKPKNNPSYTNEVETAWVQPVVTGVK